MTRFLLWTICILTTVCALVLLRNAADMPVTAKEFYLVVTFGYVFGFMSLASGMGLALEAK